MLDEFVHQPRIAYFSMEIALQDEVPTYSGGLGVLAGDTLRSAVDLGLPVVGVSLVSRAGYFHQEIDASGRQVERPDLWEPRNWAEPTEAKIAVLIEGREVWVRSWLFVVQGHLGGRQPVILLDTDLDENQSDDRKLTHYLYGGDETYRIKQEMVLGIGGVRMLNALGFRLRQYHMNEGHSAFLALELLKRFARSADEAGSASRYDAPRVREMCNFTTHTPVEAGHDQFSYDLATRVMGGFIDLDELKSLAGHDRLNMTRLALNLSEYVNGVAKRHAEVSQRAFPGYRIHTVTNGVPQLSVLDGWWLEGCIEGITGWAIGSATDDSNGDDAASLYQKLEQKVLPLYAGDRRGWIAVMKGAIGKNASYFNSHRMMRRYATEAYIR